MPFACDLGYDGAYPDYDVESEIKEFADSDTADEHLICDVNYRDVSQFEGYRKTDASSEIRRNVHGEPIDFTGGVSYLGDRPGYQRESFAYNARYDRFANPYGTQESALLYQKNMQEDDDAQTEDILRKDNGCWGKGEKYPPADTRALNIEGRSQPNYACCPWINFDNTGEEGEKFFVYVEEPIEVIPLE